MKTIRCNYQKHVGFSQLLQNYSIRIWEYFLKNFKKFHMLSEELYARLYRWYISLYVRSIEFVSILT